MSSDGRVIASAEAHPNNFRYDAPASWVSASRARVYYLEAGQTVQYFAPDGSAGIAHRLIVGSNQVAAFSVSPDDKRIAVAIYTAGDNFYFGFRLYVEDLVGSGHHIDLLSSQGRPEYPIGWVNGKLVLAATTLICCNFVPNPYGAVAIDVIDPATGNQVVELCGGNNVPEGPIETFGVMCTKRGAEFWTWDGVNLPAPAAIPLPSDHRNAVSPDGNRVAISQPPNLFIWGPAGQTDDRRLSAMVFGWLDSTRIVIKKDGDSSLSIFDDQTGSVTPLPGANYYLGVFPAALS